MCDTSAATVQSLFASCARRSTRPRTQRTRPFIARVAYGAPHRAPQTGTMDCRLRGKRITDQDSTTFLMTQPLISVVIETITARFDRAPGVLANKLEPTIEALARQTYAQAL